MFQRYIFVRAGESEIERVETAVGVEHVLRSSGHAAWISEKNILDMKVAESLGKFDDVDAGSFKKGDIARIIHGPFSGFVGEVIRRRGHGAVEVLLAFLGAPRVVEVELGGVRPAGREA